MSNEREPLLPDSRMYLSIPTDQVQFDGSIAPGVTKYPLMSAGLVRDYYENLITSGKLRAVEEVESISTIQGVTMSAKCSGCGLKPLMFNFAYCPGCGNPIKRTSPADQVEKRG